MELSADVIKQLAQFIPQIIQTLTSLDPAGLFGRMREIGAVGGFLKEAADKFTGNSLIGQVVNAVDDLLRNAEGGQPIAESLTPEGLMDKLSMVNGLLGDNPDGAGFKGFLYELAEKVAGAAGSGLFGGGQKVSDREQTFLTDLKSKLGL